MAEHLDTYLLAVTTAYILLLYVFVYRCYLRQVQLTRQHDHIGKLRIELQRLGVCYVQLCGQMHLHILLYGILHHGYIRSDDGIYTGLLGVIDYCLHHRYILGVDHRVNGQIGLYARLAADSHDLVQVVGGEVCCRASTHVQVLDTEIYTACTGFDSGCQTLVRTYGSHDFYLACPTGRSHVM